MFVALEWVGTGLSILAAVFYSFQILKPSYWIFLFSDIFLGIASYHAALHGMVTLYLTFFFINSVGIYNLQRTRNKTPRRIG